MTNSVIRLLTCGSVDDGKSTLIGRLLVETNSVPHDTVNAAKKTRRSKATAAPKAAAETAAEEVAPSTEETPAAE